MRFFKNRKKKTLLKAGPVQVRILYPYAVKALKATYREHYNASFEGIIVTAYGKVKKLHPIHEDRDILMAVAIAEMYDGE